MLALDRIISYIVFGFFELLVKVVGVVFSTTPFFARYLYGYYYYSKTSLGTKDKREALKREQELRRVKWLEKHKLINNKVVNNTTLKELMVKVAGIHQTSLLMGHTSFNTTQKYLHISINDYSFSNNNLCNYL